MSGGAVTSPLSACPTPTAKIIRSKEGIAPQGVRNQSVTEITDKSPLDHPQITAGALMQRANRRIVRSRGREIKQTLTPVLTETVSEGGTTLPPPGGERDPKSQPGAFDFDRRPNQ